MRIIGCDLHAAQQTIAMLDRNTGEIVERTLKHEGTAIRDFYAGLPPPVVVGIEATGSMGWFLQLMADHGITCRVGDPAKIRKVETRRQKHDRRDAALLLTLLAEERFPEIWMPSAELRDLRALLRHRDQWVRIRTRVKNALQGLALAHGLRRGAGLWSEAGQATLTALPLPPHTDHDIRAHAPCSAGIGRTIQDRGPAAWQVLHCRWRARTCPSAGLRRTFLLRSACEGCHSDCNRGAGATAHHVEVAPLAAVREAGTVHVLLLLPAPRST
jgi:transposase